MTVVTMRTLSRETARVVEELAASPGGVVVTRDGVPVARVLPVSAVERAMYAHLIAMGVDPWNPPQPDPTWTVAPASAPGEKTASDYLMEDRDSYYREP